MKNAMVDEAIDASDSEDEDEAGGDSDSEDPDLDGVDLDDEVGSD